MRSLRKVAILEIRFGIDILIGLFFSLFTKGK